MRYGPFLFVLMLFVTAPAFADEYHYAWEGWAPLCVAVNKDPQTKNDLPRGIIAALQGTYITPVDGETDTAKALVYPRFTSGERDYAHPYRCDLVNVYPARNIKGVQVEVWPEPDSVYYKWELTRATVTPTPPGYHDPVTPGGTPVGGALPSCTTELTVEQQVTIIQKYGCMRKSFDNLEGGLCAFGETSRDAYVYFSSYETNYQVPPKLCRDQFNGQYAVTVCPSGKFYLGIVNTATCLQGGI